MYKKLTLILFLTVAISYAGAINPVKKHHRQNVQLPLIMKLPNDNWSLAVNKQPSMYVFKRKPIIDAEGRSVIPAIMVYAEDATDYKQDVPSFWAEKTKPFIDKGLTTVKVLTWQDKDYPLSMKGAIFVQGAYTDQGTDHVLYMNYMIDKHNTGIQVYLDMTKELFATYGNEFWDTIHSIRELN
jgi:hypothetical protein